MIDSEIAMELIEHISCEAQTTNPENSGIELHKAICEIYRLAHWIRAPKCRKNHKSWGDAIVRRKSCL